MARPKKDVIDSEIDLLGFQAPDELEQALSGIPGDNVKITIWRVNAQGRPSFLCNLSPIEFDLEVVKDTFGGGQYRYTATSEGQQIKAGRFEIEGAPKGAQSNATYKKYVPGVGVVYVSKAESEKIANLENHSYDRKEPRVTENNNDIVKTLLDELRQLRQDMHSPKNSEMEFLEKLQIYKSIFQQPQVNPVSDFSKQAIDLIKEGMNVANMSEGGGNPWLTILEKALPTINRAVEAFSISQKFQPPQPAQPIQQNGAIEMPINTNPPTGFDAIANELKYHVPTFVRAASMDTDPMLLVDLTIPQLPPNKIDAIKEWLKSPSWFTDLSKLHPMIQGQTAWWSNYRHALLNELENPGGSDEEHDQTNE